MFIELAEFLRCPTDDSEAYCVVVPDEMIGRTIVTGTIGCPTSQREYRIDNGIADFCPADPSFQWPAPTSEVSTDGQTVQALLGLATPGGYVVVVGSAGVLAADLVERIGGVHLVALNPPDEVEPSSSVSVLRGPVPLPLRTSMARGVVVGREYAKEPWLSDTSRILLKGLRMVVLCEGVTVPGMQTVASGEGVWVGSRL